MNYTSITFLVYFLAPAYVLWRLAPQKFRGWVLLAASMVFYWLSSGAMVQLILLTSAVTWQAGRMIGQTGDCRREPDSRQKKKQWIFIYAVVFNAGLLLFIKYFKFLSVNLELLFSFPVLPKMSWIVQPLGISFYTLQAVSYLADVLHNRIPAEQNLAKLTLFLSFFPTIVEGPVVRYEETVDQLWQGKYPGFERTVMAFQLICWGILKKRVIADRASLYVNTIFSSPASHSGAVLLIAGLLYTLQLYADFSGCIDVVRGVSELFGISLPQNFRQPFASRSIAEFWRRWHISLGTWLKNYIFLPLAFSRRMMEIREWLRCRYPDMVLPVFIGLPLLATWIVTGLWHGAAWKYLFYGFYYFLIIYSGILLEPFAERFCRNSLIERSGTIYLRFQRIRTFLLVLAGMMIFRANRLLDFIEIMRKMLFGFQAQDLLQEATYLNAGLDIHDWMLLLFCLAVMTAVGHLQLRCSVRRLLMERPLAFQWTAELLMIFFTIIFGAYGIGYVPVNPIYGQF